MKILITGATGLIGSEIGKALSQSGHELCVVSRSRARAREILTYDAEIIEHDLSQQALPSEAFTGIDTIINLIGESIDGRWTSQKKADILSSRRKASENLLKNCPSSVKTILTSSAVGYYGDRGEEIVHEESTLGTGFLSEVCREWESAFIKQMQNKDRRVVIFRLGVVFSRKGGALKKMLTLFLNQRGGRLSTGRQWMSWVSLPEVVNVFCSALDDVHYEGVVNLVSPEPVTNAELTDMLSDILSSKQMPAAPAPVLKAVLGEMSHLLLDSTRVSPRKLRACGYHFIDIDLKSFLVKELLPYNEGYSFFSAEQFVPHAIDEVFDFFSDYRNLEKLTPKFLKFHVESISTPEVQDQSVIEYKLKLHGLPVRWKTLIEVWEPPQRFVDRQISGPYKDWQHEHTFSEVPGGILLQDEVRYKLPMGGLGSFVAGSLVAHDVESIFSYRRKIIAELFWPPEAAH